MRIHNLYEDADGESHFRDVEVDWVEESPSGRLSKRLPATGIVFRETTADYESSWHRAPRRQYVISLAGQHFPSVHACARPRARGRRKSKAVAGRQGRALPQASRSGAGRRQCWWARMVA